MKKYFNIYILNLKTSLQYRTDFFISFLSNLFPIFGLLLLWNYVYDVKSTINGLNLKQITTYYILSCLLLNFYNSNIMWEISDDIKNGIINSYLIKPLNYLRYKFINYISSQTLIMIIVIACIFLLSNLENGVIGVTSIKVFISFFLSIFLSLSIIFYFYSILAFVSFWWIDISGLFYFQAIIVQILSGSLIPLTWYPDFLQKIVNLLPFGYTIYFPVNIYLQQYNDSNLLFGFFMQLIWVLILKVICNFIWKKGNKIYDAFGG